MISLIGVGGEVLLLDVDGVSTYLDKFVLQFRLALFFPQRNDNMPRCSIQFCMY